MLATELRIGNIVKNNKPRYKDNILVIESIGYNDKVNIFYREYPICDLEPITLTEEWLLKLGFEKPTNEKPYHFKISAVEFLHSEYQNQLKCFNGNMPLFSMNCEYVHQLQNIFFALTNKELTPLY